MMIFGKRFFNDSRLSLVQWVRFTLCGMFIIALCTLAGCESETAAAPTPTYDLSFLPSPLPLPTAQPSDYEPTRLSNIGQNNATAAALPSGGELPPLQVGTQSGETRQSVVVTAADGANLVGDLYANPSGERGTGVLFIAPDRGGWLDLPLRLQAQGYTVLSMDLRATTDTAVLLGDFQAMLGALAAAGTVDPGRIVVVGAEMGADMGLIGCGANALCDALAMFSPVDSSVMDSATLRYNPRPMFLAVGRDDAAFIVGEAVRASARGTMTYQSIPGAARGTGLLVAQPALTDQLRNWLAEME